MVVGVVASLIAIHISGWASVPALGFFLPLYIMWFTHVLGACCATGMDDMDGDFCLFYWAGALQMLISAVLLHLKLTVRDYNLLIVLSPFFLTFAITLVIAARLCCCDDEACSALGVLVCMTPPALLMVFVGLYQYSVDHPDTGLWAPSFPVLMIPVWIMLFFFYIGILCIGSSERENPSENIDVLHTVTPMQLYSHYLDSYVVRLTSDAHRK
jgi:hypothetical protein